ncbi:MAG: acetoin utilization protein AcuC [Frankiaceae bacterium]|nr:acetoin utilization protein AcuC [Frankiaceae bacterium]
MSCDAVVMWDEGFLGYNFGHHPMDPQRLRLTVELARQLGVLDRVEVAAPAPADDQTLLLAHTPAYLGALRDASQQRGYHGFGLGTTDNPAFPGVFDASALIGGGSAEAARRVWAAPGGHAVNIAGGLHHAMPEEAAGFCTVNDAVIAIRVLRQLGAARVAYVDIDAHHGDGVEAAFAEDPAVLTISIHQDPRTLFPGTGRSGDIGRGAGEGTAINVPVPPETTDPDWMRAFQAIVPGALRAFAPDVLVTQCGCDSHHRDPLTELALSIEGQRAAIAALHALAHELAGGRWLALGGGGYNIAGCVPLTWTHLIAEMSGHPIDLHAPTPQAWRDDVHRTLIAPAPARMGELPDEVAARLADLAARRWELGGDDPVDRAVLATRRAVFPLLGLDPDDPRD